MKMDGNVAMPFDEDTENVPIGEERKLSDITVMGNGDEEDEGIVNKEEEHADELQDNDNIEETEDKREEEDDDELKNDEEFVVDEGNEDVDEDRKEVETTSLLENALKKRNEENDSLNKMHVMDDVREGCDTQPSSPGHAEQRTEITESEPSDGIKTTEEEIKTEQDESEYTDIVIEVGKQDESIKTDETSPKRKNDCEENSHKKPKSDIQQEFVLRNKILSEFTESLELNNYDQIQTQSEQILLDIQKLNELAKEKEREWNNILTIKKMKEELLIRIQRQRQVYLLSNGLEISETEPEDRTNGEHRPKLSAHRRRQQELRQRMKSSLEMNGHDARSNKQRPVRDVQSIIADYRQKHPETVPRRGRRIRTNGQSDGSATSRITPGGIINFANVALGSGSQVRQNLNTGIDANSDIGELLSVMDSANPDNSAASSTDSHDNTSFKDILVQFAKMSQSDKQELLQNTIKPPPPYPEVTVHPVSTTTPPANSLLHGILTKAQSKTDKTTFSPTLARLLTAPERSVASQQNQFVNNNKSASNVSISDILSTNKARNEITITPVANDYEVSPKRKHHQMDDEEAEDSVDRLVIDESGEIVDRTDNNSDAGDEVPQCQGCNQKAAQFVCAGCGNQWYCSRDCQVSAWDEHSEVCSG